ncbi:MAG: presqualene diphosphate synthase HpnD [Chloroflexota bacterium]
MARERVDPAVAAGYEHCRVVARREAANFYYGFISLAPERRRAIYAAYAFSRECDDDSDGEGPTDAKRAAIDRARRRLEDCYGGRCGNDPVLLSLADAARRFDIPRTYFEELIAGVEMDLELTRYQDFSALRQYCYRVASTVGLICLQIYGCTERRAREYAVDLGIALQLTNILRDVREDAERGRIYLPLDELNQFGCAEEDLMRQSDSAVFRELLRFQAGRARQFFASGERLLPLLDLRARACTATMGGIYRTILQGIEDGGFAVFAGRVSLSGRQKLGLVGRAWLQCFRDELGARTLGRA